MKPEEVIKEIKQRIDIAEKYYAEEVPDYIEALKAAKTALEKQRQLDYIRFIVENTFETSMGDSLAMQALRDHFKREV